MNAIKQSYIIKAPIKTVWEALTDPKVIDAWGAGPSTMSEEEGFQFSLWGGQIHGKNTEVIKEKKLVQEWLAWKAAFGISTLTIDLEDNNRTTTVNLLHINVPTKEHTSVERGWKEYFMEPLIEYVERKELSRQRQNSL